MTATVQFDIHPAWSVIRFLKFDGPAVAAFKAAIPSHRRVWNGTHKRWTVAASHSKAAYAVIAKAVGADKIAKVDHRPSAPAAAVKKEVNWAENMLAAVPAELQEKAFKALAKVLHPDMGGDTVAMQQLNGAYEKLKK